MFQRFENVTVLVVGDVMLDRYWWGTVKRISPEAPVPVVDLEKSSFAPGGAANVAVNIAGLGAKPVLLGVVGMDHDADVLIGLLNDQNVPVGGLVRSASRPTTVKTRVIAHNQQIVRVDQETKAELSATDEDEVWRHFETQLPHVGMVLLSDYAKGLLSERLTRRLIETAAKQSKQGQEAFQPRTVQFG